MDRLELLLELIKSKESLSKDGVINISLGEVSDIWGMKNVVQNNPEMLAKFFGPDYLDHGFLEDVASALEKLIADKSVIFERLGRQGLDNLP